jgi:hypothetical protein
MLDYLNYTQESHNLMKAVENTLIGGQNPQENWKYLPRDAVPTKFRKNGKFGSTQDVANKILDEYRKIC